MKEIIKIREERNEIDLKIRKKKSIKPRPGSVKW